MSDFSSLFQEFSDIQFKELLKNCEFETNVKYIFSEEKYKDRNPLDSSQKKYFNVRVS